MMNTKHALFLTSLLSHTLLSQVTPVWGMLTGDENPDSSTVHISQAQAAPLLPQDDIKRMERIREATQKIIDKTKGDLEALPVSVAAIPPVSSALPIDDEARKLQDAVESAVKRMQGNLDPKAERVIIVGPSGSGKSTLLNLLAGKRLSFVEHEDADGNITRSLTINDPLPDSVVSSNMKAGTKFPYAWPESKSRIYWDCPGFEDPEGVVPDIVNTSTIHQLFGDTVPIKIVLSWPEAELEGPRLSSFSKLLLRMTQMFSVDQLSQRLFLVITRQGRTADINPQGNLRTIAKAENVTPDVQTLAQYLVENYKERVVYFPYPNCLGDYPTEVRGKILAILGDPAVIAAEDASAPLGTNAVISPDAELHVRNLARTINGQAIRDIQHSVVPCIMEHCLKQATPDKPLKDNHTPLKKKLTTFRDELRAVQEPQHFLQVLKRFFDEGTPNPLCKHVAMLQFLKEVKKDIGPNISAWIQALQPTIDEISGYVVDPKKWYLRASTQGNSSAQEALGCMYLSGNGGVEKHPGRAAYWLARAAQPAPATQTNPLELGKVLAQLNLGVFFAEGTIASFVPKDENLAFDCFKQAAKSRQTGATGNREAQYYVGRWHQKGWGTTPKNTAEAISWLRLSADQDHPEAQNTLGIMLQQETDAAKKAEALSWFAKAANPPHNHALAQYNLGLSFLNGIGVTQNVDEGLKWLKKAAAQNHYDASNRVGLIYMQQSTKFRDWSKQVSANLRTLTRDAIFQAIGDINADSLSVFQQIPENQNFDVQGLYYTAILWMNSRAIEWFEKARTGGYMEAQANLDRINAIQVMLQHPIEAAPAVAVVVGPAE